MRLGIFLPNWIGDVVMATPVLRALRRHYGPDATLVGIMRPYVAEVLDGAPWLDARVLYDKPPCPAEFGGTAVRAQLRAARLDAILLLTNSLRTAWTAWRSGARRRVGHAGDARSWLLTEAVPRPRAADKNAPVPTIDAYLRLAAAMGCPPESPRLELGTTEADEAAADRVWRELGLPAGDEVVVFNPGGAYGSAKHWPAEHFAAVARRIVEAHGLSVLVNCGPREREIARAIVAGAADRRVVSLADYEVPLGLTKACIRRGRMLLTTDSGPRYFGIAFDRPVVTLFGPTDPRATATHYAREECLSLDLECQPCWERTCPLAHHRCMRDLSPERVYVSVERKLVEVVRRKVIGVRH